MKKIINNKHNLTEQDINDVVRRVKILFINSENEILLGHSYNEYQFPGGHIEDNEDLSSAANHELLEETGINISFKSKKPFIYYSGYYKDYPIKGNNRQIIIYYYIVYSDERPKLENTCYTNEELNGNFTLEYVPLKNVESILKSNARKYGDGNNICKEMLKILKVYKEEYEN